MNPGGCRGHPNRPRIRTRNPPRLPVQTKFSDLPLGFARCRLELFRPVHDRKRTLSGLDDAIKLKTIAIGYKAQAFRIWIGRVIFCEKNVDIVKFCPIEPERWHVW